MKLNFSNNMKSILYIFIFLLGFLFIINNNPTNLFESFSNHSQCPDLLIQKGTDIFLYNSKLANIPGRNPIRFNNLEEYTEFLQWERSQGIHCPILFLQHGFDPQGNSVYSQQELPLENTQNNNPIQKFGKNKDKSFLLNSTRNNPPYNSNQYPGFDPKNQYVGLKTPLDKIDDSQQGISPNPMDPNWGGPSYTQNLIDQGFYKENEVKIQVA